jgi:hypothetical protein
VCLTLKIRQWFKAGQLHPLAFRFDPKLGLLQVSSKPSEALGQPLLQNRPVTELLRDLLAKPSGFNKDYLYRGFWKLRNANPLFEGSTKTEGLAFSIFYEGFSELENSATDLIVKLAEDEFTDSPSLLFRLQTEYGKFDQQTSSVHFSSRMLSYLRLESTRNLAFREGNYSTLFDITLYFLNSSSGLPFNFSALDEVEPGAATQPETSSSSNQSSEASNASLQEPTKALGPDFRLLKMMITFDCFDYNLSATIEMNYAKKIESVVLQPIFYVFVTGLAMMLIVEGSNRLEDSEDYYLLSNLSYMSLLLVTIIHFQYVGAFVLFMIVSDMPVVLFFIFASIVTTFSTIFAYKACFIVFMYNYLNHPLIDNFAYNSPRVIFTLATLILLVFFYTSSIFLVGFHQYSYYLAALHSYPLVHVWNSVRRGTRNTFTKYLQVYIWWPSAVFAIMLRGYRGNMLNLEHSYLMTAYILLVLTGGTVLSYYQSVKGPFFFIPTWLKAGHRKMLVSIKNVPHEKLTEDCAICYSILLVDPADSQVEMHDMHEHGLRDSLLKQPNKKLMKTDCNHYFHVGCLTSWIERKQECPLCKASIKYF